MSATARTRVLVVDADSAWRQGLARELGANPAIEVIATAMNVRTAEPKIGNYQPDLVVLDLVSDAEQALGMLARFGTRPGTLRVIGVATDAVADQLATTAARVGCRTIVRRREGATTQSIGEVAARLAEAIVGQPAATCEAAAVAPPAPPRSAPPRPAPAAPSAATAPVVAATAAAAAALQNAAVPAAPAAPPVAAAPPPSAVASSAARRAHTGLQTPVVVGIGVSTGGPAALQQLIPALSADFPVPIVIVQHMPPGFTRSLADSLDRVSKLRVREAVHREVLLAGEVLIAPGGRHLRVVRRDGKLTTELTDDPPECSCRPSVDYLFRSLASACGGRVLGVVLTGMGEDGWIGSRLLDAAGACLLAQDEATSTVFGMPRGPLEQGIATAVGLPTMAQAIERAARSASCS